MTAITHIGLAVPDLEGAIKWYEDVLGFTLLHV
ncbi:VOC family protein [Fictibacillus enclensis]|nr:VOC family protein [Fictibacillus enclensis]WHY73705.1 VOC family protein [Fictibacillus enclensis]